MPKSQRKVISASRRIDMVGFFPQRLVEVLEKRCPADKVHSVVLWSKDPRNLFTHRMLRSTLKKYDQIFIHFTISGMGKTFLEPRIPSTSESLSLLPGLVDFVGDPQRVMVRFDPIVHLRLPDGSFYSNLNHFDEIARKSVRQNIRDMVTSWMEPYAKVRKRLEGFGISIELLSEACWREEADRLQCRAEKLGVHLKGCCVEGFPSARCIDGERLSILHPRMERASIRKAGGQRTLCGCTESWDVGWYSPCPGGCLYCYARPLVPSELSGDRPH